MMDIVAGSVILIVLLGPLLFEPFERNLEVFFLIVGVLGTVVMGQSSWSLVLRALCEPVALTAAVLVFGAMFRLLRPSIDRWFASAIKIFGPRWLCFGLTLTLGLLSSIITAIIAALLLSEGIAQLKLDRRSEVFASVLACFGIGLGASLTPIGEPLSTIVIGSLNADFWYLARLVGPFVLAGILIAAMLVSFVRTGDGVTHPIRERESWRLIFLRAGKVYIFIVGLVALSHALHPRVGVYLVRAPDALLFWINTLSAVLDNAMLAAIEIGPALHAHQQRAALLSLLVSGGMLIPGNIPNIVAAARLQIRSREWALAGLPIGLALLMVGFLALSLASI